MATPYLFINHDMRPEVMKKYDIYPVTVEEAIKIALKRVSSVADEKKDGVDCGKDGKEGKENSKDGKDGKEGKEGSEDKEACDGMLNIHFGALKNVKEFIKPLF